MTEIGAVRTSMTERRGRHICSQTHSRGEGGTSGRGGEREDGLTAAQKDRRARRCVWRAGGAGNICPDGTMTISGVGRHVSKLIKHSRCVPELLHSPRKLPPKATAHVVTISRHSETNAKTESEDTDSVSEHRFELRNQ